MLLLAVGPGLLEEVLQTHVLHVDEVRYELDLVDVGFDDRVVPFRSTGLLELFHEMPSSMTNRSVPMVELSVAIGVMEM